MKFFCVRQHDQRDCGAAVLATICKDYGIKKTLAYYRELTKTGIDGTNIFGIVDAANNLGFQAEAYQIENEELLSSKDVKFPFIARIINEQNMYHFVVVNRFDSKYFYLSDPANGKIKMSIYEFEKRFTGHIVIIEKTIDLGVVKEKSKTNLFFKNILFENKYIILMIIALTFLISGIGIVFSFSIRFVFSTLENEEQISVQYDHIDDSLLNEMYEQHEAGKLSEEEYLSNYYLIDNIIWLKDNLKTLVLIMIGTITLQAVFSYVQQRATVKISAIFSKEVIYVLTKKVIELPQKQIDRWKSGDIIRRYSDADIAASCLIKAIITIIVDSIMVIVGGIILYTQSKELFAVVCVLMLIYVVITLMYIKPLQGANVKELEKLNIQESYIKEIIDNLFDIKIYKAEEKYINDVARKVNDSIVSYKFARKKEIEQVSLVSYTSSLINILLIVVAYYLISNGKLTIGTYIGFLSLMDFFVSPIEALVGIQGTIQNGIVASERFSDLIDINDEIIKKEEGIFSLDNEILINQATFRYGNAFPVFEKMTIKIPAHKLSIITGDNGVGKSTLAKLLMGMYSLEEGQILFDNNDITKFTQEQIGDSVIYLSQDTKMFTDTVRSNILYGYDKIDEIEFDLICDITGVKDFCEKLNNKYDYLVEEQGKNISTGQRQRIGIARALLRKPKLLIMDESISNIDAIGQSKIIKKIKKHFPEMTLLLIGHNLKELDNVDNLIHI